MLVSFGIRLLLFCLGFCLICHSQVCIPTWTPYARSYSTGGSPKSPVLLLQDCLARCERLNDCVAVDFYLNRDVSCFLHDDIRDLTGDNFHAGENDNVTQYRITRNCTNYGKGPECPVQWIQNTSIGSYNGEQVNYWTEYDCFTYCLYSNGCAAVYYDNRTSPPCWINRDQDPMNVNDGYGVVQYRLNKTCPSSASPSSFQIDRCVGQYFPNTSWCPPGAKIQIKDAWFKINPLCCYRNAEDAYPPDASSLTSLQVSYLDPTFFNEINSSCEGQSHCNSSIRAKSNSALKADQHCLDGDIGTNYVTITYQCISDGVTTSTEMMKKTTAAAATATASSTVQTKNSPDVDKAASNGIETNKKSYDLIIGLVIGLGVPLILIIIIVVVILVKRRKRKGTDEPNESYRVESDYYASETMPRGAVPEYEVNEISMTADAL